MKKVTILIIGLIFVGFAVITLANQASNEQLSEAEVREKFRCDRITADVLATDIYCQNPEYYYEDKKNGTVIDDSDFGDPRYKELYEKPLQSTYGYNPNYADAIQQQNPELCENIEYALLSGPTDAIQKITGQSATATCQQQAEAGFFGCECDSEATLNAMRIAN